jgi:tetratricopeptide (TPR) repeat protein
MPGPDWVDNLSESLRAHESERAAIQASLPRYEILGEIRRGGMGVVYRAWDPQLGREVALKVLLEEGGATPEARERFLREAQLAANLHHPNIVPVYDTGECMGQLYLAMLLIEGTTLDQAKLDLRGNLAAVRDAARALDYAHAQGVVHRDVKPSNLMVDRQGHVYVTDFGLARRTDVSAKLTLSGVILGTPTYMPPEQARGQEATPRSDVYSLGATLYELVSGAAPFTGSDALSVVQGVILQDPVPPRGKNPSLPSVIETIILKAMEKEPERRYSTAGALADDLQRYLDGEPVLARRPSLAWRARKLLRRHPWVTMAAAFLIIFLTIGTAVGLDFLQARRDFERAERGSDPRVRLDLYARCSKWYPSARLRITEIQDDQRREAEEAKRKTEEVATFQTRAADDARRRTRELEEKDLARKALEDLFNECRKLLEGGHFREALEKIARLREKDPGRALLLAGPEFTAGLQQLEVLAREGTAADFRELFDALSSRAYSTQPEHDLRLSRAALSLALKLLEGGRAKEALEWFQQAARLGNGDPVLLQQRGLARLEQGELDEAEKDFWQYNERRPFGEKPPPRYADLFHRKGVQRLEAGHPDEALQDFEKAIEIDRGHAEALRDRGLARFRAHGLSREALDDLKEASRLKPALKLARGWAEVALSYAGSVAGRATAMDAGKEREDAWREALRGLEVVGPHLEGEAPELLLEQARLRRRLREYGLALQDALRAGDRPEARLLQGQIRFVQGHVPSRDEKLLRQAQADFEAAGSAYWRGICRQILRAPEGEVIGDLSRVSLPDAQRRLAQIHHAAGRSKEAVDLATQALAGADRLSDDERVALFAEDQGLSAAEANRRFQADTLFLRASARYRMQEYEDAIKDFSDALDTRPQDAEALVGRGSARTAKKDYDAAIQDFNDALAIDPRHPAAYAGRGTAWENKNDVKRAAEDYRRALKYAPADWRHRPEIGARLKALGESP